MQTQALFLECAESYKLVSEVDADAVTLFESDDADDVLAFAEDHGLAVHTLDA